ncbi:hypothetical protein CGC50_10665 [Capnocytophaga gingivalis]|uniref:BNR/Asp-box repeat protein n=1 Tax=Capnocytophaga gingivalis TaxID=1017 RepID=A0A250FSV9_9FLAO|nr:hypothetical protein [Capnocytophaga gingivalis]ATA88220.1 hypothetical protein CGC50_10665 [Capnocytophaga gingivalis]
MKTMKNRLLIDLQLAILLILVIGCTTLIPDNNMKWTAKYNFMDLYKKRNYGFNPGSDKQLSLVFSPMENVIILGAQKDTPNFDPTATERQAVLYISTDRGQSYKELILEGNDVYDIAAYTKEYSIVKTSGDKNRYIYLLNHKTFEIKEIDKYNRDDEIYYDDFDGRFLKCEKNEIRFLVDVLSKDSVKLYEIPKKLTAYQYYPIHQNGDILYYNGILELRTYNVITGEDKLFRQLKHKYDFLSPENYLDYNTPLSLLKIENMDDEEREITTVYDLEENFVRKITKENREKYYYYKDFICDYTKFHTHTELRFSFDKGKTWKTHKIPMVGLFGFNKNVGFFEDKYIIFEGIFFRGDSPESGGRIMVGEFQK